MRRLLSTLLLAGLISTSLGCGGEDTPKGKDLEDLQNKSQQKADEEERAYQKEQLKKK